MMSSTSSGDRCGRDGAGVDRDAIGCGGAGYGLLRLLLHLIDIAGEIARWVCGIYGVYRLELVYRSITGRDLRRFVAEVRVRVNFL
jgi:hypothetical protein